jgi:hypothetical protein
MHLAFNYIYEDMDIHCSLLVWTFIIISKLESPEHSWDPHEEPVSLCCNQTKDEHHIVEDIAVVKTVVH